METGAVVADARLDDRVTRPEVGVAGGVCFGDGGADEPANNRVIGDGAGGGVPIG